MSIRAIAVVIVLAFVFIGAAPSWGRAQATAVTGQIEGVVTDASDAVLAGATVSAHNEATGFARSAVTDQDGRYRLSQLPLGSYTLRAERQGFAPVERQGLVLTVGDTLTLTLRLGLAGLSESALATADAFMETTRTLLSVSIGERAIGSLPINGRRFQDFMLLTPGAVVEGQRNGTSVNGQRGINAAFNVDGTSWDNPFFGGIKGGERSGEAYTLSQEAIKEFAVASAGYAAEFGRSSGAVMNAVTKSGSNTVSGSAFWYYRNEAMVSADTFGRPPTDFRQHQFGGSIGGPLVRDRTHVFFAYDQQVKDNPFTVQFSTPNRTGEGVPGFQGQAGTFLQTNDIETVFGRVDHRIDTNNSVWVRYNYSHNEGVNGLSTAVSNLAVSNSGLEKDSTNTVVLSWHSVVSATRLNELRVQVSREDRPREPNSNDPAINITGLGVIGRRTFLPSIETDDRYQIVNSFTWLRGRHSIRAGTDLNLLHVGQPFFLSRAAGEYRFNSTADYLATLETGVQRWRDFRQGFGRAAVDFWQKEYAGYIQDTWALLPSLSVNYGLRYEAQINPTPDDPNPALPESGQIPSDTNNWGPRAGLSWLASRDGRTVVRANVGLYYSRTPALLMVAPITTNGRAAFQLTFTPTSAGAPVFPNILAAPPAGVAIPVSDVNYFDPGFENPRTFQASLSVERELIANTTVAAEMVFSDSVNMQRMFDTNLAPASRTNSDGRLFYGNPRPNALFNRMLRSESTAKAHYTGTVVSARRRWSGQDAWYFKGLQFQVSYTYGQAKDDDSNERNFSATFYQDWQNLAAEYSWAETDVRHNVVANATWELAGDVRLGIIQFARTGRPFSLTSTTDLNGDGTFDQDRQYLNGVDTGRNAFRHPNFSRTDIRVTKSVRLTRYAVEVSVDIFNLFDKGNRFVGATNRNFLGNQDAGVPNEQIGGSRQGQVSVRLQF